MSIFHSKIEYRYFNINTYNFLNLFFFHVLFFHFAFFPLFFFPKLVKAKSPRRYIFLEQHLIDGYLFTYFFSPLPRPQLPLVEQVLFIYNVIYIILHRITLDNYCLKLQTFHGLLNFVLYFYWI